MKSLTRRTFAVIAVAAALVTGGATFGPQVAAAGEFKTKIYQPKGGVAIHGYDPVAYFTASKPTKGDPSHSYKWNNATWHFASAKNRDMFKANPTKYAPQFGGYCAYGLAQGGLVPINPNAWAVHNGKLYLNVNPTVQKWWNKDRDGFIKKAHANEAKAFKGLK